MPRLMMITLLFTYILPISIGIYGRRTGRSGCKKLLAAVLIPAIFFLIKDLNGVMHGENTLLGLAIDTFWEGSIIRIGVSLGTIDIIFGLTVVQVSGGVSAYSTSYMKYDCHTIRFISYLTLFTAFMLLFIFSYNLITLFIGWEGIGIMSGLLVSYWYNQDNSIRSALKAMFVNRVGDYALSLALFISLGYLGSSEFDIINGNHLEIFGLFLLISLLAKSAQLLLHTWLPDAMAAPTPVSSLLHAATMVTAGLFLLFKFSNGEYIGFNNKYLSIFLLFLSGITAILSASIGHSLFDIKKVIAFSTCSQLGIIAVSLSYYGFQTGFFHLYTHAIFKALLFLAAGSIIHGLKDHQDIRYYGALYNILPVTSATMIIGSIALTGLPFLAGFYSKDSILDYAYISLDFISLIGFWSVSVATLYTGFYSFYSLYHVSFGQPSSSYSSYKGAHESDRIILTTLTLFAIGSLIAGFLYFSNVDALGSRSLSYFLYSLIPSVLGLTGVIIANSINYLKSFSFLNVLNNKYYWDRINHFYSRYVLESSIIKFLILDKAKNENQLYRAAYIASRTSKIMLRRAINPDHLALAFTTILIINHFVLIYMFIQS